MTLRAKLLRRLLQTMLAILFETVALPHLVVRCSLRTLLIVVCILARLLVFYILQVEIIIRANFGGVRIARCYRARRLTGNLRRRGLF